MRSYLIPACLALLLASAGSLAAEPAAPAEQHDPMIKLSEAVITLPLQDGVTIQEAVDSMKLRANQLNVKFVGEMPLWKEYEALGLENTQQTVIFQFCDARTAKLMLDYDINFLAYMPCRIGLIQGTDGKTWLVTMNLNIFISSDTLPPELEKLAIKIRDDIEQIMEAGASGAL